MPPYDLADLKAALLDLPAANAAARADAAERNAQLTKPPGALGRLEDLAQWYAGWRGDPRPRVERPQVIVFAGNHGVAARGVSAFPSEVTAQMVANFRAGGAAINRLAQAFGARIDVHPLALDTPTADFTEAPAMGTEAFLEAITEGRNAVDPAADVVIVGEMGIGNTTSAAAVTAGLFGGAPEDWIGRGTGVDEAGLSRKAEVVATGLARHRDALSDPLAVLRCLGGRELAAMAGAILACRQRRIPVLLDGFICTAAASVLYKVNPQALDHCQAGHLSAEHAHRRLLESLGLAPLLALDMRLGEGTGATMALAILQGAIACHSGMATFAEAGVSDA